ncbi:MAG: autotransporter-associated beta strand [Sutterella sp. 63_29]|nr:MAG: autotransporter-associated beta strand [Sutterella sp. 63_29]
MNRVYKTKWSAAHQQYVVTDEHHATKGKAAKSTLAIAVASIMMATGAQAAYMEPGFVAENSTQVTEAQKSFETSEYQKDWGLTAMHASKAYALGFNGKGVTVGVMDSGALLNIHPDLTGDRFSVSSAKGEYGTVGNRYPQAVDKDAGKVGNPFKPGDKFDIDGNWKEGVNDSHGTHVTGTVGGNRDGSEFHGVAWGSNIIVGNTGATDDNNYGPFQDYQYFKAAWGDLADKVAKANGKRGGVINNSWGTNTRVVDQKDKGHDGYNTGVHLNVNTEAETDYEFMLFAKRYGSFDTVPNNGIVDNTSFVYAAYEAVKDRNIVQIMTTGNRDMKNPYYRALYPLYNPAAEKHWIAVAGLKQGSKAGSYELIKNFNEAGQGKWWTVAAPGNGIYSSTTDDHGNPGYASWGGTSMAAPHVAGAMGVLMSRYDQMNALQVRDVMFTTANHKNADGSNMEGWTDVNGTVRKDGEVSDRMGWGVPDLDKGMYGPGQFLGKFEYNMAKDSLDVWSNDISNVALDQRKAEDDAWMTATKNGTELAYGDIITGKDFVVKDGDGEVTESDRTSHIVGEHEKATLLAAYAERAQAIKDKRANGYKGTLVKQGEGTLIMTGNNSYAGTTTVEGGTLLAFAESIGTDNKVTVKTGGTFGVLSSYNDQFTMKGHLYSKEATTNTLEIDLSQGGKLYVDAGSNVKVQKVTFGSNKVISVGLAGADTETLVKAWNSKEAAVTGSFEVTDGQNVFDSVTTKNMDVKSVFFKLGQTTVGDKKIDVKMEKNADVTFEQFASTANEQKIAAAIEASGNKLTGEILSAKTENEIRDTYRALDDDFYATARNALVVNATAVSRTVMDQARGMGEGRSAEVDNGRARIWAAGIGHWGEAEGTKNTMDVDFRTGFLGAEALVLDNTKFGAFFGYGTTDYKSGLNKIDGEDKHFGVYGLTDIGNVTMTYGVAYTDEDRDTVRVMNTNVNQHSENASVLQGFVEGAYNFDLSVAKVSPYVGFTWARVETDAVTDHMDTNSYKTDEIKDDIQIATLGVRTSVPFAMGNMPVALTADLGWSHYFGDTEGLVNVQMGEGGKFAAIEGSELKDQANLGLGIVGQVAKHATVGVSYSGSWGSDINTHGIFANVRFNF